MKPSLLRTIVAGLAGGAALNASMVLTFRLLGFGWNGHGILMDPEVQSAKLIGVWSGEPVPIVVSSNPAPIVVGLILFGLLHAFFYRMAAVAWPRGIVRRAGLLAFAVFTFSFLFWEFFTPFNQLHEPVKLIGLELVFWAIIALADGLAIAAVMETGPRGSAEAKSS
ncbi:MAG: hypothetical protein BIFFINMI_03439 [Phycisphaerae bacterium]|nr:hypothetical protein [Phycisphaerae bacterium]